MPDAPALPGHDALADTPTTPGSVATGIATMLASGVSNQVGAAVGAHAFGAIGPAGVVAVRQVVAAAVLLPVARPAIRRMTWGQWWPTLLLAAVFSVMNLSLYTAIDRIGLGLAVTLEFLGPLAIALAGSRTRLHLLTALAAAVGVYVLVLPGPTSDLPGIALAVLAAACWAAYIHLNRLLGARLPGLQGPAVATTISSLIYLPVLSVLILQGRMTGLPLLYAISAGVLSSLVPYAADLTALRHIPTRFFGVFMSLHPVWAALAGLLVLGQVLAGHEWTGIGIVVTANAVAVLTTRPPRHRKPPIGATMPEARTTRPCTGTALAAIPHAGPRFPPEADRLTAEHNSRSSAARTASHATARPVPPVAPAMA